MRHPDEVAGIPIAIIGMACRLPGADNLDEFWKMLVQGRSTVRELSADRLDQELYYDPTVGARGKTYSKLASTCSSRDFDQQACPIPDHLVRSADNAHLLMCETAANALRNAGMDPFDVKFKNTGVYIGHAQGSDLAGDFTYGTCVEEAAQFLRQVEGFQSLDPQTQDEIVHAVVQDVRGRMPRMTESAPDAAAQMVAGTISRAFGFNGPFVAINSACASSLHAVLVGARALQLGRVDMAVVGGASDCKSDSLVLFSNARAMSPTGTRPFDDEADGLVIAEGYVAIVLKTLERAIADGDEIQAVVRGAGISSDGKGKSLWAPRKEGQIKAMQRAYRAGVDMSSLQYLEAHATATQLGDATELNTLSEVLEGKLEPGKKIPVTSLKANIGHALETAGAAGLVKAVLAMRNATFPPAINIKNLNRKIDWDNVPVYIPTTATPWPAPADGKPRCAGVNAFGIGGLNMHVVIEEFNESSRRLVAPPQRPAADVAAPEDEAIAVVGMGCVLPGALNVQAYWDLLVSGRNPKQPVPDGRWRTDLAYRPGSHEAYHSSGTIGGFITDFEYDWRKHKVPPKQVAQADPLQFMLLDAADQAMADAGYDTREFDRERVGVVVGTEFGGDFAFQLQVGLRLPELENLIKRLLAARGLGTQQCAEIAAKYSETLIKNWPALIDETGSFSTSSLASRISKSWNLMGGAVAVDGGSASSMSALSIGVDGLLAGDCDMVICAGGQRRLGLPIYESMSINRVLADDNTDRSPLDAAAEGYFPGEGVGVVLLKRLSDAQRDGDKIRCIIRGIGAANADNDAEALQLAIGRSLKISSVAPDDVTLVETDTSGSPETDGEAIRATTNVLGQVNRNQPLTVSTAVGQVGHTLGASGMVSLIKACLELETGQVPATFGFDSPPPSLSSTPQVRVPKQAVTIGDASNAGRRLAGINSSSRKLTFHTIIQHGSQVCESAAVATPAAASAPVVAADFRICRIGATSHEHLISQLNQAQADAAQRFASADACRFLPTDRFRLAIVADSAATLTKKLQNAVKQIAVPAAREVLERQGIFYRQVGAQRPRVAMLFAGQGSQYSGMLRELVDHVPAARAAMVEVDQVMTQLGLATFAEAAWDDATQLGKDVWTTQAAMLMADWIMLAALRDRGMKPNLVAGHSFGEYAALLACGAWSLADAVRVTRARCAGIDAVAHAHGGMLATNATPEALEQLIPAIDAPLYVANHNAPDQSVVGGTVAGLDELAAALKRNSYQARRLPVPCPFHTPLMKDATGPMTQAIAVAQFHQPNTEMWSLVTNRPVNGPDEIRANLVAHMTTPVRYVDLIRSMASQQDTVFVEVGPQQSLTRMHKKILEDRDVAAISSDVPKRSALEQLNNVQALLECAGVGERTVERPNVPAAPEGSPARNTGEIIEFDATQRRREKMRQAATGKQAAAPSVPLASAQPTPTPAPAPVATPTPSAAATTPAPAQSPPTPPPASLPPAVEAAPSVDTSQLETFLINFVVEQTGYPKEVVELDADLEADLGIDSIKKAQLFGELQEYFDITPTDDLTLDDFPTLRHVLNFLAGAPSTGVVAEAAPAVVESTPPAAPVEVAPAAAPVEAAPAAAAAPATTSADAAQLETFLINFVVEQTGYPSEVVELDADLEADLGIDSIKKAQLFGELQEYFDITPTDDLTLDDFPTLRHVLNFLAGAPSTGVVAEAAPAVVESTPPAAPVEVAPQASPVEVAPPAAAVPATTSADTAQLETFLINFVVEQTGYPADVVELDADLEADLGIDSIKKAQLFGELQEYFDITPTDDLTLDDFPTLRHVLNFLAGAPSAGVVAEAAPAVVESTPPAAPVEVAPPASPVEVAPPAAAVPATTSADTAQLETFLINFVVEQTGYPADVVELDADLEADLGIDSIKKAQLFGELQEYFDITPTDDLTLDDFPTLRHVLNFLAGAPSAGVVAEAAPAVVESTPPAAPVEVAPPAAAVPATTSADTAQLETFLINFVVEQTGYPPEVVELDADLEADLGIDSIKKAQLFGELQEYFDITPTDDLTLDDFPTLRHVLNFLAGAPSAGVVAETAPAASVATASASASTSASGHGQASAVATPQPAAAPTTTDVASLPDNSAYNLGRAHGMKNRAQIIEALRQYADLPETKLGDTLKSTNGNRDPRSLFENAESEQLRGIADAVQVPFGNIAAYRLRNGRLLPPPNSIGYEESPAASDNSPPYDMGDLDTASVTSNRYTMRTIELPLPEDGAEAPTWTGPALVVGDNPMATALRSRLEGLGVKVQKLDITDDLDETLANFERLWRAEPTTHLFLTSARDENLPSPYDNAAWQRRRYLGVTLPFFLCQRWVQLASEAKMLDKCSLVGFASLGGDCGFSGHVGAVESGAITALMKAIFIEFSFLQKIKTFRVLAVDAPASEPVDQLAANICRELAADVPDCEVAYVGNSRRVQNGIPRPAEVQQFADVRPGGVWVVTGGARGITAACALELARRFDLRIHLLGTSPEPDIDPAWRDLSEEETKQLKASVMREASQRKENMDDAWRRVEKAIEIDKCLRAYQQANVRATYHTCDVSDPTSLAAVLDSIRTTDGPIEGILHGAGIDVSCRFQKKKRDIVEATIGSKADGARHLMALTRDDPVGYFIGFGSVSGRLGSNGQADYCVASDLLAKLIDWYRTERPSCRAACIHWSPWADVGMAARPNSLAMLKAAISPELMPLQEGIQHFIREIYAGVPDNEVLITSAEYFQRYFGEASHTIPDAPPVPAPDTPVQLAGDTKWDTPPSPDQRIARRAVLRAFEAPLPADAAATPVFDGPVLILGDNADARALEQTLVLSGANVKRLVPQVDVQQTIAEFEALWSTHPATTMFLMTARDADAAQTLERSAWQRRKAVGVMLPFLLAQRWFQLLAEQPQATRRRLVAVTSLGGDLGCQSDIHAPEGGMLTGLLKSLYIEDSRNDVHRLVAKVVDAPADEQPDALANSILRELAADQPDVEVGYTEGRRYVIRSVDEPVEQLPQLDLPRGGTWVVTGGARGITSATAYVLARRYGLKLHLIGNSPAPEENAPWINATEDQLKAIKKKIVLEAVSKGVSPEDGWQAVKKDMEIYENLQMFKDAGVEVTYYQCDVSDWDALGDVLEQIRAADGPIEAVIHGAGYSRSSRFQDLDRKNIDKCFESKVDGAMALMTLTRQDPIKFFVGFGSISGRFGGNGLCDYAAANDMLAKLTGWFRRQRPGAAATSFHWQSWDEVGMAMMPESSMGAKGVLKMDFISPREAISHLHQEMRAGLPEGEVIIDDGYFHKTFYPHEANAPESPAPANVLPPLIESVAKQANGGIRVTVRYNPTTDPFLVEHRLKDKPFLPGVAGMETIAEAAQLAAGGRRVVGLRDVHIINGLACGGDDSVVTQVTATETAGGIECLMTTEQRDRKGRVIQADRPIVQATAELGDGAMTIDAPDLMQPPLGWFPNSYPDDAMLYHGPPLRCLKECFYQYDGGWGKIIAPHVSELAGQRSADGWILPVAVLDACVVSCGSFIFMQFGGALEVPYQFDRLRFVRQPREGEVCVIRTFFRGREDRHSQFDFTLYGETGDVILKADGYRTVLVAQGGV